MALEGAVGGLRFKDMLGLNRWGMGEVYCEHGRVQGPWVRVLCAQDRAHLLKGVTARNKGVCW